MITEIIMYCESCGFEGDVDQGDIDLTLDLAQKRYTFKAVCPTCDELIVNHIEASNV